MELDGGTSTITRSAPGRYRVSFPGFPSSGGTVQVTTGIELAGAVGGFCKAVCWGSALVDLACFDKSGASADRGFSVVHSNGRSPDGLPYCSYAWADQPTTASYTPSTSYQQSARPAGVPVNNVTIQRSGRGAYTVTIPSMNGAGTGHVTSYGGTADYCKIAGWDRVSGNVLMNVYCYTPAGATTDTRFVVTYSSPN